MERNMLEPNTLGNSDSSENKGGGSLLQVRLIESLRKGLWLRWIWVTALGGAGGGIALQIGFGKGRFLWLIGFGILGLAIGLAQSLVLGRVLHQPGKSIRIVIQWTLASLVGCVAGGMASSIATFSLTLLLMVALNVDYTWVYRFGGPVLWTSSVLLSAIAVSGLQQLILRTKFSSLREWTWTSIVGWCAGLATGWGVAHITAGSDVVKGVTGGAIGGIMLGAITGGALIRLLTVSRMRTDP